MRALTVHEDGPANAPTMVLDSVFEEGQKARLAMAEEALQHRDEGEMCAGSRGGLG